MTIQRTLCIIKPDAVEQRRAGDIIQRILVEGFRILGMRQVSLSKAQAEAFYAVHRERPFFGPLVNFMVSGPIVVVALEAESAVSRWRDLIGATDPAKAAEGTLRRKYGRSLSENAVHGSDSEENGRSECAFFFSGIELL